MNKIKSIQLKAGFLLIVFSLNTIIGFACAMGLDMSFNSAHHVEEVKKALVHVHADGKKHLHNNEANDATEHHGEKSKDHHQEESIIANTHIHANGKKHVHNDASKEVKQHQANKEFDQHHDEKVNDHRESSDKENCCNDSVTKIIQQDKAIASSINITTPIFFTSFITGFYNVDALLSKGADSRIKYFVRHHHPPIPDIRISIQSFLI